jgi:hypothetical protein
MVSGSIYWKPQGEFYRRLSLGLHFTEVFLGIAGRSGSFMQRCGESGEYLGPVRTTSKIFGGI